MLYAKFVVLTSSRTGSTWLIDLLNIQSGVEAHGELFLAEPRLAPAIAGRTDFGRFIEMHGTPRLTRIPRVFSYLNELYQAPCTVGFKLMYTQLRRHPEILLYLALRRIRVVHLVRRNHLDVIVSEELARITGISHAPVGSRIDVPKVYLDPTTLVDRIRRRSRRAIEARGLLRLSTCPLLEVTYEAMLNGEQEFARICTFLGIAGLVAPGQSKLAKRGSITHRDAITNYDEVRRTLISTPFASLLK